ncbi:hypothetical protein KKG45_07015 [bacterium]|nr:hypothetical protein [bacterium]MBU1072980.1 hypothetical protein [bacterium]MBU1677036.1 hypothetical protein [bacterium]
MGERLGALVFAFMLVVIPPSTSSATDETWVQRFDAANLNDMPTAMAVDDSGHVYVTGASNFDIGLGLDVCTIKYANDGPQRWCARYNGPGDNTDEGHDIAIDHAGDVVVALSSIGSRPGSDANLWDAALAKYDRYGVEQWVSRFPGTATDTIDYHVLGLFVGVDGVDNVYLAGTHEDIVNSYDFLLLKYDPDGVLLWARTFDGSAHGEDRPTGLAVDDAGHAYLTGRSRCPGTGLDYCTLCYGPSGALLWSDTYNGTLMPVEDDFDSATDIVLDGAGNVVVTGGSSSVATAYDICTIKYDPDGDRLWVRRYDGPSDDEIISYFTDSGLALTVDALDNVIVTGTVAHDENGVDYMTLKYDPDGALQWTDHRVSPGNDYAHAVATDPQLNVYVSGQRTDAGEYIFCTRKLNTHGMFVWEETYNGPGLGTDNPVAVLVHENAVFVTGGSARTMIDLDYCTIRYDQDPPTAVLRIAIPAAQLLPPSPNPFNPATEIRFSLDRPAEVALDVYAADGRHVRSLFSGAAPAGDSAVVWRGRDDAGRVVPAGPYLLKLRVGGAFASAKVVLLK